MTKTIMIVRLQKVIRELQAIESEDWYNEANILSSDDISKLVETRNDLRKLVEKLRGEK